MTTEEVIGRLRQLAKAADTTYDVEALTLAIEALKCQMTDWSTAPEWANWLAMDSDGAWYWYEDKPKKIGMLWARSMGQCQQLARSLTINNWDTTLENRPNQNQ